jgi:hypothetical protein
VSSTEGREVSTGEDEADTGDRTEGVREADVPAPANEAVEPVQPDDPPDGRQGPVVTEPSTEQDPPQPAEEEPPPNMEKEPGPQTPEEYTERGLRPRNAAGAVIKPQRGRVFRRGGGRR